MTRTFMWFLCLASAGINVSLGLNADTFVAASLVIVAMGEK